LDYTESKKGLIVMGASHSDKSPMYLFLKLTSTEQ